MSAGVRVDTVAQIAEYLAARQLGHPLRVAVDGITAAGKSMLATELAAAVQDRGRPVIRLSGDDFHHRSAHRYRQGRDSCNGYYEDAYDFEKLAGLVLRPLGPDGDRSYHARVHDLRTDAVIDDEVEHAPDDAVLLLDGSFLQRPELAPHWDDVLFVHTTFGVARTRGTIRDATLFGGRARAQHAFDSRYHAACRRYLTEIDPQSRANIVLGNDDVLRPDILRLSLPADGPERVVPAAEPRLAHRT